MYYCINDETIINLQDIICVTKDPRSNTTIKIIFKNTSKVKLEFGSERLRDDAFDKLVYKLKAAKFTQNAFES